jgi:hypothetical protein
LINLLLSLYLWIHIIFMTRIIIAILTLVALVTTAQAQRRQTNSVQGFSGGYYLSMLPNTDDLNADKRLDNVMTFNWGAAYERFKWTSNTFGHGWQLGYYNKGQDYSGVYDTVNKYNFTASTKMQYIKANYFIHFRSYNRYLPEQRFRFNSFLGPYAAFLLNFKDAAVVTDANNNKVGDFYFSPSGFRNNLNASSQFDVSTPIYKLYDIGFTVAPGFQYMITRKLGIAFHVRADISATNVENVKNLKRKTSDPNQQDYYAWNNLYAKYLPYNQYNPSLKKDEYNVRSGTKNFTVGAFLTIRWYALPQYE